MSNINDIFRGIKSDAKVSNIINSIAVDWNEHSKGIINIAKHLEPNFIVNKSNQKVLRLLLLYFTGSPHFEEIYKEQTGKDGSLNKGIFLVGNVGTGKSLIFQIFDHYTKHVIRLNTYKNFTAISIIDNVNVSGVKLLSEFSDNIIDRKAMPITCYIDDIASKNEMIKNFGTELSVIEQLLSMRYNVYERYKVLTHCSSNKYPAEMNGIYDARLIDRFKKMFNYISLEGDSFRK